ncbi:MAG: ImmA/IrrE family metallo-endopeptidase [Candidatus Omnitrophota bacterium]
METDLTSKTEARTMENFYTNVLFEHGEIDNANDWLTFDYTKITPRILAREFTKYFELQYPVALEQLLKICYDSDFSVEILPDHHKPRGANFSYNGETKILFKEKDSPPGQIHTVLHELYEVIDRHLYSLSDVDCKRKRSEIEAKADQFATYVHVPDENVVNWINSNGLEVFGLTDQLTCSYATALIRLNEVLCGVVRVSSATHIPMIALLYDRPYWKKTSSGRTPRLQLRAYTKSRGFPFKMSRAETEKLRFFRKDIGQMTVHSLIRAFSKDDRGCNVLIPNAEMHFDAVALTSDILIRTVKWRNHRYTAKVLLQIVPSAEKDLMKLAQRQGFDIYEARNER